jgi:hypothetical protein
MFLMLCFHLNLNVFKMKRIKDNSQIANYWCNVLHFPIFFFIFFCLNPQVFKRDRFDNLKFAMEITKV